MQRPTSEDAAGEKVYFRFVGSHELGIASVDVAIPKEVLFKGEDGPESSPSLLATMAKDAWRTNELLGTNMNEPIISCPLESPCRDDWHPQLAEMIVGAYKDRFAMGNKRVQRHPYDIRAVFDGSPWKHLKRPFTKLPPGVELEEACRVLDYYGIPFDKVDLSEVSDVVKIRSILFIKESKLVYDAKGFILSHLKSHPEWETHFLFLEEEYNVGGTKSFEKQYEEEFNNGIALTRIEKYNGNFMISKPYVDLMKQAKNRDALVSMLQHSGFEAEFVTGSNLGSELPYANGYPSTSPKEGHCWVEVQHIDSSDSKMPLTYLDRCVLKVTVPKASQRKRTREKTTPKALQRKRTRENRDA